MGMDLFQVNDFIDQRGVCEVNMNIVLDMMNNPQYRCPLKVTFQQPMMMQGNGQQVLMNMQPQQMPVNPMMGAMQQQLQGQFVNQGQAQGY